MPACHVREATGDGARPWAPAVSIGHWKDPHKIGCSDLGDCIYIYTPEAQAPIPPNLRRERRPRFAPFVPSGADAPRAPPGDRESQRDQAFGSGDQAGWDGLGRFGSTAFAGSEEPKEEGPMELACKRHPN